MLGREDLVSRLFSNVGVYCVYAAGIWVSAQLVTGVGLDGSASRQALACAAGPAAVWVVAALANVSRDRVGPTSRCGPGLACGFALVLFVSALGMFSIGVAVSAALGLPLRASGLWTHVLAGLITLSVAQLAQDVTRAVMPAVPGQGSAARRNLVRPTAAIAGLWLAAALPGVSIGAAPAWQQALALTVLAHGLTTFRYTYGAHDWDGDTDTTGYAMEVIEPFVPNLGLTAIGLLVVVWLSTRLEVGLEVDGWLVLLPVIGIVGALLTVARRLAPLVFR